MTVQEHGCFDMDFARAMPVNRRGTSRRFGNRTLPTGTFPSGRQLVLMASLCGPLLFPLSTAASLPGNGGIAAPALPSLPGSVDRHAAAVPKLRSRLTGFPGPAPQPLSDAGSGAWFQDEARQLQGLGARFQPFRPVGQGLGLEATHLSRAIVGAEPGQAIGQNNAWSLAANSRLLDNRLLLQGEYAVSHQLREQPGATVAQQGGEAHSLLASFQATPSMLAGRPSHWSLEVSREYAEAGFWSLANLDHARDRVVDRAAGRLGWGRLDAAFSYSRADEVRPAGLPERRLDTQTAELGFHTASPAWLPGDGAWLGRMRYRLAMQRQWVGRPAGEPAAAELYTESANLTAHFAPGPWWWEIGHARTATYRNDSGALLNGNDLTNLRLHLPLGERLSLMPEFQWGTLEGPGGSDGMERVTGSLAGSATLVPERVHARLVLRASRQYGADEARDTRMVGVESSLSWALRTPRAHAPGVSLSLSGRYQQTETEGAAAHPPADYQALARFEFSWAPVN